MKKVKAVSEKIDTKQFEISTQSTKDEINNQITKIKSFLDEKGYPAYQVDYLLFEIKFTNVMGERGLEEKLDCYFSDGLFDYNNPNNQVRSVSVIYSTDDDVVSIIAGTFDTSKEFIYFDPNGVDGINSPEYELAIDTMITKLRTF